jgi:predicted kinase
MFVMVVGLPGAGKTTWCDAFERQPKTASFVIVHSDDVRRELTGDINDQSQNDAVWAEVLLRVQAALAAGTHTILDATNVDTIRRRTFVKQLPPCRKRVKMLFVGERVARGRIARDLREGKSRSAVPDKILSAMQKKFSESLLTLPHEGWRPFSEEEFFAN